MTSVYLCGPISGLTYQEATEWREQATEELTSMGYEVFNPMRSKEDLADEYRSRGIDATAKPNVFARDMYDVERADIVLANLYGLSSFSIGSFVELGAAYSQYKFIIVVAEPAEKLGPPLVGEKGYHPFLLGLTQKGAIVNTFEEAYALIGSLEPVRAARLEHMVIQPHWLDEDFPEPPFRPDWLGPGDWEHGEMGEIQGLRFTDNEPYPELEPDADGFYGTI